MNSKIIFPYHNCILINWHKNRIWLPKFVNLADPGINISNHEVKYLFQFFIITWCYYIFTNYYEIQARHDLKFISFNIFDLSLLSRKKYYLFQEAVVDPMQIKGGNYYCTWSLTPSMLNFCLSLCLNLVYHFLIKRNLVCRL